VQLALEQMVAMADENGLSVLGLIHHNKSRSPDPLQVVMASKAFPAVAIKKAARAAGHSDWAVCRAREQLGLLVEHMSGAAGHVTLWTLPESVSRDREGGFVRIPRGLSRTHIRVTPRDPMPLA
jgi:hypothetical protein